MTPDELERQFRDELDALTEGPDQRRRAKERIAGQRIINDIETGVKAEDHKQGRKSYFGPKYAFEVLVALVKFWRQVDN